MRLSVVGNNGIKAVPSPGSEFNTFLFAPIGEETNGMILSVVSALSRNELDPWEEAATLSRLSTEAATQRLASLMGTLPHLAMTRTDRLAIAARLVASLPDRSTTHRQHGLLPVARVASKTPAAFYIVLAILALGAQLLLAGRQPAPPATDAPAKATVSVPGSSSSQERK